MNIQWYPGHMTKAKRQMQEDLKLIDLIIELVDARAPLASRNPDIDQMGQGKARMILLNKADLADERQNEAWSAYFAGMGIQTVKVDSRSGAGMKEIQAGIRTACQAKIERDKKRGIKNRPIRAMVAGIPNVGKSTFINSFAGRACAKTGNRPGVTKGKQWIRLNKNVELLDTPGILWPKFEDPEAGIKLAMVGSVKDDVVNMEELALELIGFLAEYYPDCLASRYGIAKEAAALPDRKESEERGLNDAESKGSAEQNVIFGKKAAELAVLENIARARGCLKKGEELDYARTAGILFDDFRSGKIGRVTLEWVK